MNLLLEKVSDFSKNAHEGQFDKGGHPYFLHVQKVASMGENENEIIVGYLHDILEDTLYTINDIKSLGINNECINAIICLTHNKNISYDDYIMNIKKCELARKVKINDLKNNMDLSRLKIVTNKDLERVKKYAKALAFLSEK